MCHQGTENEHNVGSTQPTKQTPFLDILGFKKQSGHIHVVSKVLQCDLVSPVLVSNS